MSDSNPHSSAVAALSCLPAGALEGLRRVDRLWQAYRQDDIPQPLLVKESPDQLDRVEWDAVICGGTLGILLGCVLAQRGWRVVLIERGRLRGRDQEWNISRRELSVLVELELLTAAELEQAIATEYNPARIRFADVELQVENVLNVGVDPVYLLDTLKSKFLAAGGHLLEHTSFEGAVVHPNGVGVDAGQRLTARLLLDAMGHFSPIAQQVRAGAPPDAVCLVVGTCAQGFSDNSTGDLLAAFTPSQNQCQYFWEAFPARDGRTTYLFTYLDAHPDRPSLEDLFVDYLRLLPEYQGVAVEQLQIQRALYGFFPCYRHSPLRSPWNRLLFVGDSSGGQSPLSFGGFGAMVRHLKRLTEGIDAALAADRLDCGSLGLLQPYQPNLAVTWLFQRAMSIGVNQSIAPDQINALLAAVFTEMARLGDEVLKPFLQDVVQFPALSQAMLRTALFHPRLILRVIPQVGITALLTWLGHYFALGGYSLLARLGRAIDPLLRNLPFVPRYDWDCWLQAWQYGAGDDYRD